MKRTFGDTRFFHAQVRVGRGNSAMLVRKLRTLPRGAHVAYGKDVAHQFNPFDVVYSGKPTVLGKIVRGTKLDELPQFLNFFRGELRLIGWRPITRQEFRQFDPEVKRIYSQMGPGLFGIYYALPKKQRTYENVVKLYKAFYSEWKRNRFGAYIKYLPRIFLNLFR